jgi:hypothetical protein
MTPHRKPATGESHNPFRFDPVAEAAGPTPSVISVHVQSVLTHGRRDDENSSHPNPDGAIVHPPTRRRETAASAARLADRRARRKPPPRANSADRSLPADAIRIAGRGGLT